MEEGASVNRWARGMWQMWKRITCSSPCIGEERGAPLAPVLTVTSCSENPQDAHGPQETPFAQGGLYGFSL